MRWRRRRTVREVEAGPEPPRNVRIVQPDGQVVPVELVYAGQDGHGIHVWQAVTTVAVQPGSQIVAEVVPARSQLTLYVRAS